MSHEAVQFDELLTWMKRNNKSLRTMATEVEEDKSKLWRLVHGRIRSFDLELMDKIERYTNGEIGQRQFNAFRRRLTGPKARPGMRISAAKLAAIGGTRP